MTTASSKTKADPGRPRAEDIDRQVGARMRKRRILLGLTQQQAAKLVGLTYQQWHKYEKGINRVAASRLLAIAQALGVEVNHFFADLDDERAVELTSQQRMLLEFARNFTSIPSRKHQEAICNLVRVLANPELAVHEDEAAGVGPLS